MKNKVILVSMFILFFLYPTVGQAASSPPANPGEQEVVSAQLNNLDLTAIEEYVAKIDREITQYVPELDIRDALTKLAKGELDFNSMDIFNGILKYLFKELVANFKLLGQLVILAVICAVLQNLQSAFEKGTTGTVAFAVVYLALISLAIGSFTIAVNIGREAIDNMVSFMNALLPVLLTLLAAMGGLASAAIFHPLMVTVLGVIGALVKNVVFPLLFFAAILDIISNISERFQVSRLAGLFRTVGLGLMGIFLTVFMGIVAVQGVAGSVADGVALRTAKYATGVFVPVVGKMFSDALEAVVSSSVLLKNAVGLVGVIVIFILCAFPALKIITVMFVYKVAAAVVQPIGEGRIVACLSAMGKSLTLVFAAVATVGLMFFFAITVMVGAGNMTVMLR
ncbi:MAG: stage III sporulation protein AE [Clostridia bacterium]|nr:stage III sporulation protein AE [Clostridia bacterium]